MMRLQRFDLNLSRRNRARPSSLRQREEIVSNLVKMNTELTEIDLKLSELDFPGSSTDTDQLRRQRAAAMRRPHEPGTQDSNSIGAPSSPRPFEKKQVQSPDVKKTVIETLAVIGDPNAVDPIVECLKSDDTFIRNAAKEALVQFGSSSVLSLMRYLRTSTDDWRDD